MNFKLSINDFKLTINEALEIQAKQIRHYGPRFAGGESALRAVMESRNKIPPGADRDEKISVIEINRMVPRGGDIEYVVHGQDHGGN